MTRNIESLIEDVRVISRLEPGKKIGVAKNGSLYHSSGKLSRWFYSQNRRKTIQGLNALLEELLRHSPAKIGLYLLETALQKLKEMRDKTYTNISDSTFIETMLNPFIQAFDKYIHSTTAPQDNALKRLHTLNCQLRPHINPIGAILEELMKSQ